MNTNVCANISKQKYQYWNSSILAEVCHTYGCGAKD